MSSDFRTTFQDPSCPTPSGSASGGGGTSGGYDLTDGRKETANMSGLPALPTTVGIGDGDPGIGQIPEPPVASPGTIPSKGFGN